MNKLKELRDKLAKLQTELEELEAKKVSEKREFTKEEIEAGKTKLEEYRKIKEEISDLEAAQKITEHNAEFRSAGQTIEVHNDADEAKYSFGEMLQDVVREARSHIVTPRLDAHQKRNLEVYRKEARSNGLNENIPAEGGFLVGKDNATGLLTKAYDNTQVAGRCSRTTISANSNGIKMNGIDETNRANGSRFGGVVSYWVEEGGTLTGSKPKFRQMELTLKKNAVLYYATDEELADAAALESNVNRCVSGEIDFALQDAIINGNGAGKPLGVMNSPCLVTVSKESGQSADTVVFENMSKMWARLWAPSRANAVWLYNQEMDPQFDTMALAVGTGGIPLQRDPFRGRPAIAIEQCAGLGDLGDIILGDFSQYQLADKGGVQIASSMHVQFLTDEMVFRFIYRVDGQPIWHSALTPYKGTASTLSPFVTLEAR